MTSSLFPKIATAVCAGGMLLIFSEAHAAAPSRSREELEAATRLQVFLDRAEFAPGKIDGRYGEFTVKALALYRQSRGEAAISTEPGASQKGTTPDTSGLDLAGVNPLFQEYTVTDADLQSVGELPAEVAAQAKLKVLPYKDAAEAIAEKYHMDVDFLAELNPGKTKAIKAGDVLTVVNVPPFDLASVKDLKAGSDLQDRAANDTEEPASAETEKSETPKKKAQESKDSAAPTTSVKVDIKTNMVTVYEQDKLIAAYPVTVGSAETVSPVGDWKIRGVAKMPNFRYDKAMLNKGERSSDFKMLPPGPNNPVGILWIALNKKGIGLHGTSDPDAIGRSASHGCIRLANWDIVRLAGKVKIGVPVAIH